MRHKTGCPGSLFQARWKKFQGTIYDNRGVISAIIQLDAQKCTDHFKVIYLLIGKIRKA